MLLYKTCAVEDLDMLGRLCIIIHGILISCNSQGCVVLQVLQQCSARLKIAMYSYQHWQQDGVARCSDWMAAASVPLALFYITPLQCQTSTTGAVKLHQTEHDVVHIHNNPSQAALLTPGSHATCQQICILDQHCQQSHSYVTTLKMPSCFSFPLDDFLSQTACDCDGGWHWKQWHRCHASTNHIQNQKPVKTNTICNCSSSFWRCEECLHILLPGGLVILRTIEWRPDRLTDK